MSAAPPLPRLLLITDRNRTSGRTIVDVVAQAVEAGVRFIQIRERGLGDSELGVLVEAIVRRAPADTRIAVNSSAALAAALGLGLHLPAAAPLPDLAGIPFWGRSTHDQDELARGIAEGASYAIVGTLFPTPSKPGHPGRGLPWLRELRLARFATPVFAIGGIDAPRAAAARAAGAYGVAVCGSIMAASDPGLAAAALIEATRSVADSSPSRS